MANAIVLILMGTALLLYPSKDGSSSSVVCFGLLSLSMFLVAAVGFNSLFEEKEPKGGRLGHKPHYCPPAEGAKYEVWIPVSGKEAADKLCMYFRKMKDVFRIESNYVYNSEGLVNGRDIGVHLWTTREDVTAQQFLDQIIYSLAMNFNPNILENESVVEEK